MSKFIPTAITVITIVTLGVLGFALGGFNLSQNQLDTLLILGIIAGSGAAYCFIVGEISRNNSQMDKLWSILPIAYGWVIAAKGDFKPRLLIIAIIITLWGIRLTFNFARKGAYHWKFWEGREDYRWEIVRGFKVFKNPVAWAMFDLLFISIYQNTLVLIMTFPALAMIDSTAALGIWDFVGAGLAFAFLLLETIADEYQWKFHQNKKKLMQNGAKLEEIDAPYNKGFNTTGPWGYMRHPNYLGEQGIWVSFYIMTVSAGVCSYGLFNWSLFGPMFIIFLFLASSPLGESISNSKYPEYKYYLNYVFKYLPVRKYDYEKAKAKYEAENNEDNLKAETI